MLRRLRRHRGWMAAVAAGILGVPALLSGVAAAPADNQGLEPPDFDPREMLPPDPADLEAALMRSRLDRIADLAPEKWRSLVVDTAQIHQLDPRLLAAVITVETEWDPHAVGTHGERGLMQIMPATGAFLARVTGLTEYDLSDPRTSLSLGAFYLSALIREYGSVPKALSVYNGGPAAADGWESNRYARKVLTFFQITRAESALNKAS